MLRATFEPVGEILRLTFSGVLTTADVDAIDPLIVGVMLERGCAELGIRTIYDMRLLERIAVPSSRFAERARLAPIGKLMRVVVAPPWANGSNFGSTYRNAQALYSHAQPTIVPTLLESYRLLSLADPQVAPFGQEDFAESAVESGGYIVRITRHEAVTDSFGWEIVRKSDRLELARSVRTFSTRLDALADSAKAAASLESTTVKPKSAPSHDKECPS